MKSFRALIIIFAMSLCFCAGGMVYASSFNEEAAERAYTIGICTDTKNDYSAYEISGFKDAIINKVDNEDIIFAEQDSNNSLSASAAVETLIQARSRLIFTIGDASLEAAANLTSDIPVIFSDVIDYRNVLHLLPDTGSITGRNVSGISGINSAERMLSLLIEACDHTPKAVGILYDPADTDSILQNELIEEYMNSAGICWREYEIRDDLTTEQAIANETEAAATPLTLPSINAAPSGKEGANIHPDSLGESGDLTGINEPMSARSMKIGSLWKNPTDISDMSWSEIVELACRQCDVLYICSGNVITDDPDIMNLIRQQTEITKTITVGGDADIGADTTVCLFQDPYALGYRCGVMAAAVINGDDIEDMPIEACDPEYTTKLFNRTLSSKLGKAWPKSFVDRESFLADYSSEGLTEAAERITENEK